MNFLRTIFWVALVAVAAFFCANNWFRVPITILKDSSVVEINLPLLLLGAFLIGLVPPLILHRATRWSFKRKLDTAERALADIRGPSPTPTGGTLPPAAAPIAAPPGVS